MHAVIETRRTILRELILDDVDSLLQIFADPVAMQHYPSTKNREQTEKWIRWNLESYEEHRFGLWAMVEKQTGIFLGECGITIQHVDGIDEPEIGYHVVRDRWGQGFATEAASACRDYGFQMFRLGRLIAWMHPANLGSRRVAEKIGMQLEKQTSDSHDRPAVVYAIRSAN